MANMQDYRVPNDTDGDQDGSTIDLKTAKDRVAQATKWRAGARYDEKWAKLIRMYASQYDYPELSAYEDVVAPNLMFSTANVIIPSIVVNHPKITVTARKPEDEANAAVVEAVSNYNWEHFDFHEEVKLMVKDFVVIGHGWCKVTWELKEEEVEIPRDEWKQLAAQALMEAKQAQEMYRQQGIKMDVPSDDQIIAGVPTKKTVVTADHPAVERVSPFDLYLDPEATRIKDVRWIAQRRYVPLSEARENEDWEPKARKALKGSAMSEAKKDFNDLLFSGEERGKDADFVVVWEYYDTLERAMCVFADGSDMFLLKPEPMPYPFGHPFVPALNYIVPEKLYPIGDLETVMPLQMELALTRTQMVNDRKRFRRMYMYRPDQLGPDAVAALTSSDDNVLLPIDGDTPFADVFAPVTTQTLSAEFYNQTAMIIDDINLVSGVTEYQRGGASEIRRTATEASMIQDMSNARSAEKLSIIEGTISQIAQYTVQLAQKFLTTDQVAKIVGDNGAVIWKPYAPEDIQGEFDFQVEAGSTQPMNESFRRQSAMQLLDAMAPFISAGVVNPMKLAEHVLRNGFGIKDPGQFLMAPPPPMPGEDPNAGGMPPGVAPPDTGMPPMM